MAAEEVSDGILVLRPLTLEDADRHLAGEDEEQVRWLNFGQRSTLETVRSFIRRMQDARSEGRPIWNFGIWLADTGELVGNVEANAESGRLVGVGPGEANISYVIFPPWRRRGYATRAVTLLCAFLASQHIERAVIRAHPENTASLRVAARVGFHPRGMVENVQGPLRCFVRDLSPSS